MAADRKETNALAYVHGTAEDWTLDAVPRAIKARYFTDGRGGGRAYYVDPTIRRPAFRDKGDVLTTARSDRQVIEDMTQIAARRFWVSVEVTGSKAFRREAWLEAAGYEIGVKGYKPSERDLQDLDRRVEQRLAAQRAEGLARDEVAARVRQSAGSATPLKALEAGIKARIVDPVVRARLLEGARDRIAGWLERGGRFDAADRRPSAPAGREHSHGR
jgi:hypothetical protein